MKIASFNINNVNKRLPNLLSWLAAERPDVVCLQELKAEDQAFPLAAIEAAGYRAVWRIAGDADPAGEGPAAILINRAQQAGIDAITLSPRLGDFNQDQRLLGVDALRAASGFRSRQTTLRFMGLAA
ncbi:Exonuclease III-like protein [Methylocella silvestris BL2]|uniref:Exonuclease III-like protein n=1 Tax=Methylocella silvestris (strain DSM 15510 / CIP 108128 / LMG 27833 / NCIMB 13906 / BL2) TaxID=395965 RepID=B8ESZ3_METSB|nr:endonuclease/exonuclease/phosphatase family protein [Methylocella silvestris]ACK51131.1 Exonuclease III-like protein [Methylocella silvestris BL2]